MHPVNPTLRRLAAHALCAAALALPAAAGAQAAAPADLQLKFEAAQARYRAQQFAGAYGRFVELADRGHADAARIAWMMYRWGTPLYGAAWYASAPQIRAWSALVAQDAQDAQRALALPADQ
jgi:hypothetical protein